MAWELESCNLHPDLLGSTLYLTASTFILLMQVKVKSSKIVEGKQMIPKEFQESENDS